MWLYYSNNRLIQAGGILSDSSVNDLSNAALF